MAAFYAIQRKSDGAFLPWGRRGSNSHVEPSKTEPPRLFETKAGATNCLVMWSQGVWHLRRSGGGGMFADDYAAWFDVEPDTARKREDYEVIPVAVSRRRRVRI